MKAEIETREGKLLKIEKKGEHTNLVFNDPEITLTKEECKQLAKLLGI